MPGIVGLITRKPRIVAEQELERMLAAVRHESCYNTGTWIEESSGIYVGWAARKNTFSDGMPLKNERGDVSLVFSGEEYPEPGTGLRLRQCDHVFESAASSYLVHLYEEDPGFPVGLNGRFHGLVADRNRGVATLFNDRYGMHRIYYHESKEAFYFAAEAKAILAVCPELRSADSRGLGELVAYGCVLENRTVFRGIHVLPPASAWTFRSGFIERKGFYFQPGEWEDQDPLDEESYYQELKAVFSRNLPRYFNGRQKIGMSLTGGLDSRMIMAWQKPEPGSLPCYSFGGTFRDSHDIRVAREVARTCRQPYKVIPVADNFLNRFPHYAERTVYLTDGCADVSCSTDLYANERASERAPVRMTGNYGSEVLRGVRAFKPVEPAAGLFRPELLSEVHTAAETYRAQLQGNRLSFAVFRQAPWHHYGLLALEQTQLSIRTPYLDNDLVRTVFRAPQSTLASNSICVRLVSDGNTALKRIPTDRGLAGVQGRMASAISRSLLHFTFKAEYAYDYGMPQWVARGDHLFAPLHLERLFLGRHKFSHFRIWYRDALAGYVQEMLLDSRTLSRPYLDRSALETMVRRHVKGDRNYTSAIHKVLTLEIMHRLFFDS
jgi:asparagine synthase (glutamine-hydrolysing)